MHKVTLMNFGDNTRVVHAADGTPVVIDIGRVREVSLHKSSYELIRSGMMMGDCLIMVTEGVQMPPDMKKVTDLLAKIDDTDYDTLLEEYGLVAGAENAAVKPTRIEMRGKLGAMASHFCKANARALIKAVESGKEMDSSLIRPVDKDVGGTGKPDDAPPPRWDEELEEPKHPLRHLDQRHESLKPLGEVVSEMKDTTEDDGLDIDLGRQAGSERPPGREAPEEKKPVPVPPRPKPDGKKIIKGQSKKKAKKVAKAKSPPPKRAAGTRERVRL